MNVRELLEMMGKAGWKLSTPASSRHRCECNPDKDAKFSSCYRFYECELKRGTETYNKYKDEPLYGDSVICIKAGLNTECIKCEHGKAHKYVYSHCKFDICQATKHDKCACIKVKEST